MQATFSPRRAGPARAGAFHRAILCGAALLPALGWCAAAPADDRDNCLMCHQYRGLSRFDAGTSQLHVFSINPEYTHRQLGPHARLACTDCHPRSAVGVVPHAPVPRVNCIQTCHLMDPGGLERRFTHANIAAMLDGSAHARESLAKLGFTDGPLLDPGQSTCLYCHDEPVFRDATRVLPVLSDLGSRTFDRCDVCHSQQIPVDIAYYVRHIAARLQPARSTLALAQVCAVCHNDPQVLASHDMSNAIVSYLRSFHGKAALLGDQRTANCLSCHVAAGENAHLMLKPTDPKSSVNPQHVADSCRSLACHPGADMKLAAAAVHLDLSTARGTAEFALAAAFILLTVATFGPSMLIVVLELFQLVLVRHHEDHHSLVALTRKVLTRPEGRALLERFTVSQRVQHWVLVVLFALLALTGFPMKFADRGWAREIIDLFGSLEMARRVHHWAGVALLAGFALHMIYVGYTLIRQVQRPAADGRKPGLVAAFLALPMLVTLADAKKMLLLLAYLAGLRSEPPTFGRFNVKEKFEYIGVFWGTTLLGVTGALLWGQELFSHYISGRVLNIALICHTYEAFLAIIHVGILHIINVVFAPHVFPLSLATITGQTPVLELAEGHSEQVLAAAQSLNIPLEGGAAHG